MIYFNIKIAFYKIYKDFLFVQLIIVLKLYTILYIVKILYIDKINLYVFFPAFSSIQSESKSIIIYRE